MRFAAKVDTDGPCWLWTGYVGNHGYGVFGVDHKTVLAHRYSYERFVGEIPTGLQIDHLCREKTCVHPDHLEAVTQSENIHRSDCVTAINARKTHCKRGHSLEPPNMYLYRHPTAGRIERRCRECYGGNTNL